MKKRLVLLLVLSLTVSLSACGSKETKEAEEQYETVKYEEVKNTDGDSLQDTKLTDYVPANSDEAYEEMVEPVQSENSITVSHNLILPEGLAFEGNMIYSIEPKDFKGNVQRYANIVDSRTGEKAYTEVEALAYAEIDLCDSNNNYDGSRERINTTVSMGSLDVEKDYHLEPGLYRFSTTLPVSHLALFADKSTQLLQQYFVSDEEPIEVSVRDGMYIHGNALTYEYIGILLDEVETDGVNIDPYTDIESYTVSHNIVSYNKIDRR